MTHFVEAGGRFALACAELLAGGFALGYVDLWSAGEPPAAPATPGGVEPATPAARARKAKAASKTRFTCPGCASHAWAKPTAHLICGDCDQRMQPESGSEEGR